MPHPLVWIAAVLLLCRLGLAQAIAPIPSATGYLTDQVGIVEPAEMARIQVMLGKYEVATGRHLSVLLVEATPDEELEDFADRVLAQWGLNEREQGGALLLWSGEGYVLIRPSGALAERLNQEAQDQILSRWVVPAFGRGEAGLGLRQGLEQMIAVLDGGSVAEPTPQTASPPSPSDARAQERAVLEALEHDPAQAQERDGDVQPGSGSIEASVSYDGLPVWIGRLPEDLRRLAAPFSKDLDAGVMGWLRAAGREADQLPVQVSALLLQMRGERVEPPFPGLSEFAVYAWAASLGMALLVLLSRRAYVPALFMGAIDTGFFLWLATGFVALSGLLVVLGLLAPLLVPLLRAILRGADDAERDDPSPAARLVQMPVRSVARAASSARPMASTIRSAGARTVSPHPTPVRPPPVRPPMALPSATGAGRQQVDVLLDRLGRIAFAEARRLRLMHLGILLGLCVISFPLAIVIVLGTVAVTAYRSGAVYLLVDVLVKERNAREQLKRQLPRPSADVVPES